MTTTTQQKKRKRRAGLAVLAAGTVMQFGLIDSCDDALIDLTRIFDPCGTVFSNCTPGSFFANNVEIGSEEAHCFDPTCTIPGLCNPGVPPLGTIRDPCN